MGADHLADDGQAQPAACGRGVLVKTLKDDVLLAPGNTASLIGDGQTRAAPSKRAASPIRPSPCSTAFSSRLRSASRKSSAWPYVGKASGRSMSNGRPCARARGRTIAAASRARRARLTGAGFSVRPAFSLRARSSSWATRRSICARSWSISCQSRPGAPPPVRAASEGQLRQGGAQLVRRVLSETPLSRKGACHAVQRAVHRIHQGKNFGRKPGARQACIRMARADPPGFLQRARKRPQAPRGDEPDQD